MKKSSLNGSLLELETRSGAGFRAGMCGGCELTPIDAIGTFGGFTSSSNGFFFISGPDTNASISTNVLNASSSVETFFFSDHCVLK